MKRPTRLVQRGRRTASHPGTVNLPVARASTVTFDSIAEMEAVQFGTDWCVTWRPSFSKSILGAMPFNQSYCGSELLTLPWPSVIARLRERTSSTVLTLVRCQTAARCSGAWLIVD